MSALSSFIFAARVATNKWACLDGRKYKQLWICSSCIRLARGNLQGPRAKQKFVFARAAAGTRYLHHFMLGCKFLEGQVMWWFFYLGGRRLKWGTGPKRTASGFSCSPDADLPRSCRFSHLILHSAYIMPVENEMISTRRDRGPARQRS
jgi:hypothetical protein